MAFNKDNADTEAHCSFVSGVIAGVQAGS